MNNELERADKLLIGLIDLAEMEMENSKAKKFFSKDLAEAVGLIISLVYGRFGNNDK